MQFRCQGCFLLCSIPHCFSLCFLCLKPGPIATELATQTLCRDSPPQAPAWPAPGWRGSCGRGPPQGCMSCTRGQGGGGWYLVQAILLVIGQGKRRPSSGLCVPARRGNWGASWRTCRSPVGRLGIRWHQNFRPSPWSRMQTLCEQSTDGATAAGCSASRAFGDACECCSPLGHIVLRVVCLLCRADAVRGGRAEAQGAQAAAVILQSSRDEANSSH